MNNRKYLDYAAILALHLFIFYSVFSSEYAYLDEINQLWLKAGKDNFLLFATQGRWLTGVLFDKLFKSIDSIADLKYLRIFSLAGWILLSFALYYFFQKWQTIGGWPKVVAKLMTVYSICCIPVAVYIGWASCMEMFIGVFFAVLSSHLLFTFLQKQTQDYISIPTGLSILIVGSGVASLFTYQSTFGIFLLPFLIHFFANPEKGIGKKQIIPLAFYVAIYVVYFALFKYSISAGYIQASDRTQISFNVLDKISFFFSGPLPMAFTFNYVYETQTIFPQVLGPLLLISWVVSVFHKNKERGIAKSIQILFVVLVTLACSYLPSLIAKENFPAYRTLFAFQLTVFGMAIIQLEFYLQKYKYKEITYVFLCLLVVGLGFYNFNFQFRKPLQKEYAVFKSYFRQVYKPEMTRVFFVRADQKVFQKKFRIRSANDEIGRPSTSREWVPEHLIKQTVYEITNDRKKADLVEVVQFASKELFLHSNLPITENDIIVDMDDLLLK
jgi:hypothetical protein